MSDHLTTEDDLRDALHALAPEDLEVSDFRQRLDRSLAAESDKRPDRPAGDGEVMLLPVGWAEPRGRRHGRRVELTTAIAIAVCAAAVAALLLVILPVDNSGRSTSTPATAPTVPNSVRPLLLPGTIIIATFEGTGSRTFDVASRPLPAHFAYTAYGNCTGGGSLGIAQQTITGSCQGSGGFGTDNAVSNGRLSITASPATSWQITLTLAPELQTNGSVQSPVDDDLTGSDNGIRHSGQGSRTITFAGETSPVTPGARYRLRLVCAGAGVTLPGLSARDMKGLQTKTCFAGREYVWDDVRLTTPARVRVEATPGTTWTIAIDSM